MRADAYAGVRNDEIGRAEAAEEVARRRLCCLDVGDVQRVGDDGAGKRKADRPARYQAEDGTGGSVEPSQRLSDARGSAGDDYSCGGFSYYLAFRTWSTR